MKIVPDVKEGESTRALLFQLLLLALLMLVVIEESNFEKPCQMWIDCQRTRALLLRSQMLTSYD